MFLFNGGLSRDINKDSFIASLNALLSLAKISKDSKLASCPKYKRCSLTADSLGFLTRLLVNGVIPRCSLALTLKCLSVLP